MMARDLIFDIGLHTGKDTAFYLKKGFRVVAVEANDALVEETSRRFADEIDAGRLTIHHAAIGEREGTIDFFVNDQKDDWGTTSTAFVERNEALGTTHTKVEVPCVSLQRIIEKHGIPYYAKIGGRYQRTPYHQLDRWWRRWTGREPAGWYDIHAGRAR